MAAPSTLDAASEVDALRAAMADAGTVVPVGGRTHWEVGGPPPTGVEVRAPAGIVAYEPGDLTVTVRAGTVVADLDAVLAEAGQECPLDPRDPVRATVGGTLAAGLSGHRRLRYGPLRDRLLEVRFVTGDGRLVKGGGPTVKNVTGYDVPRLLVGSLGTIGVMVQVTLRCQPRAQVAAWYDAPGDPVVARRTLFRPACVAWDGTRTRFLLEGYADDVEAEVAAAGLVPGAARPELPAGPYRGRISVRPGRIASLGDELGGIAGLAFLAEVGVGTVHVAAPGPEPVRAARAAAERRGGSLLREAGSDVDGFGAPLVNLDVMRRVKAGLDPAGKLSPGRLPLDADGRGSPPR